MDKHQKRMKTLCVFCLEKKKTMSSFKEQPEIYQFFTNFDASLYPTVICMSCNTQFKSFCKNGDEKSKNQLAAKISNAGHTNQTQEKNEEFSNGDCGCFFCDFVRNKKFTSGQRAATSYVKHNIKHTTERLCGQCLTETSCLNKHKCQQTVFLNNIQKLLEEKGLLEQFVSKSLRRLSKNGKANHVVKLKSMRGKEIPILYNYKPRCLSKSNVNLMKSTFLRSGRKLNANLRLIRKVFGRKSVTLEIQQLLCVEQEKIEEIICSKVEFNSKIYLLKVILTVI